jgi:hypothetical protein
MLHEVAIDLPDRSEVCIGRVTFPAPGTYRLQAQTPFGLDLFAVGFDGTSYQAEVAEPLRGRFPADALAREVGRIYLGECPARETSCTVGDGELTETLDPATGAVTRRAWRFPDGRALDVTYAEYGWYGDLWLARRIELRSGAYRVDIALTGVGRSP